MKYFSFILLFISAGLMIHFSSSLNYNERINEVLFSQEYFVAWLVSINFLLVFINTFVFMIETHNAAKKTDPNHLDEKQKKVDNINSSIFNFFNFLTIIISIIIPIIYLGRYYDKVKLTWEELFYISEWASLIMFIFFLIADISIYYQFKSAKVSNTHKLKNLNDNSLKQLVATILDEISKSLSFTKFAIFLIDFTGLIGIALILLITHNLEKNQDIIFVEGFSIGAIAFHILFTQMIFSILNIFSIKGNLK